MPVYEYVAINRNGKKVRGTLDAESTRTAKQKLRKDNLFPTSLKEATKAAQEKSSNISKYFTPTKVSNQELAVATRQFATLVSAGLPVVTALSALGEQTDSPVLTRILVNVREDVEEGKALAKALSEYPKSFPRLYVNLIAAGEASGNLDNVLEQLADYLESQTALRRKIKAALTYPVVMLFVCTAVIIGLIVGVIPRIVDIFTKQGAELPVPTKIMIALSNFIISYWFLLVALIAISIYLLAWYYRQPHGRAHVDRILLRLPLFSPIYIKVLTSRVSGTLGTLLGSGVGLLQSIDITKNIIGNVHAVDVLEQAKEGVREGKSLANELSRGGIFPSMLSRMIAVGEKSGALEQMLQKAGASYESDVEASLEGLTSLLEPLLMIVVGVIVLMIVISVLLPMADLINVVGGV